MDIESPDHLERLRAEGAIKAVCLVERPGGGGRTVRFERSAKNRLYWPLIEERLALLLGSAQVEDAAEVREVYGQACVVLVVSLRPGTAAPFAVAVVAGDREVAGSVVGVIRDVTRDYWFGSTFFK